MIAIRRSEERGHADHGWLDAHHTFSFASYHDPDFMAFGPLRVLNQDVVQAGRGFGTHPHRDMEILTWVLRGALAHKDSMGNGSTVHPGEAQFMSAGSGVTHSELNAEQDEELELLQMWVFPRHEGTRPRYDQRSFPDSQRRGRLRLVASPDGAEGSITIDQDARMYAALLDGAETIRHTLPAGRMAWLHVAKGSVLLNGERLGPGDGAGIRDERALVLAEGEQAELVLWELPEES